MKKFLLIFTIALLCLSKMVSSQTINCTPPPLVCEGGTYVISYTASFTPGGLNVFTVQLSDQYGSFVSPTFLGSITSGSMSSTISFTMPVFYVANGTYLIRVNSSNVPVTGTYQTLSAVKPFLNVGSNLTVCSGNSVSLNPSVMNFSFVNWTSNGTGTFSNTTIKNPVYTPSVADVLAGNVNFTINVTSSSCPSSPVIGNLSATIAPLPVASFTHPAPVCANAPFTFTNASTISIGTMSYTWRFGDGNMNITLNPAHTYTIAGNYVATLTTTSSSGCVNAYSKIITVNAKPNLAITALPNDTVCAGESVILSAVSNDATNYNWITTSQTTSSIHLAVPTSRYYVLQITNGICYKKDSIYVSVKQKPTLTFNIGNATCGNSNGSVSTSISGTAPFKYLWAHNGSTNNSVSGLNANSYLFKVTDATGCSQSAYANVGNTDGPIITSFTATPTTCPSSCNGSASLTISGGTIPYMYNWGAVTAANVSSVSALCVGTYSFSIRDANNCVTLGIGSITASGTNPVIFGKIKLASVAVNNARVELLGGGSGTLALIPNVASNVDVNGNYMFANVPVGNYLLSANPDDVAYPLSAKTYYVNANNWQSATPIAATCNTSSQKDINLFGFAPLAGSDNINGIIYDLNSGKTNLVGDPIPGVDVSLEQNPGGIMVAQTTTDVNGKYQFVNVPAGNFSLIVDMPGIGMTSSHNIVAGGGLTHTDNNFYVDSAITIYSTEPVLTALASKPTNDFVIKAFPNPFTSQLTVAISTETNTAVAIELYTVLGENMMVLESKLSKGINYISLPNLDKLTKGIYILKVKFNGTAQIIRVVKSTE